MATETVNESPSETNPCSRERVLLALDAAGELESIGNELIAHAQNLASDFFIRGLSIRVKELACVVMSALFDDLDPVVEIQARLTGLPRQHEGANDEC